MNLSNLIFRFLPPKGLSLVQGASAINVPAIAEDLETYNLYTVTVKDDGDVLMTVDDITIKLKNQQVQLNFSEGIAGLFADLFVPGQLTIGNIQFLTDPEIVFLTNSGGTPINLTGWYMYSHDGTQPPTCPIVTSQLFTFPSGTILQPGQTIQIQSGPAAVDDPANGIYRWTGLFIWNNLGDILTVYDNNDQLVAIYAYGHCA